MGNTNRYERISNTANFEADRQAERRYVAAPGDSSRRAFLTTATALSAASMARVAIGRDYGPNAAPVRYPEPDVIALDKRFEKYKLAAAPIQRLHTGMLWAEGPAWNAVGRHLVWSDIPNNVQLRWLNEDGHVSTLRSPSNNSNGNTFDFRGRQISCEHALRRVVRYELDGTVTVLAKEWQGKPLNAPNDAVVHPDGAIWFTDPGYGSMWNYEGNKGTLFLKEAVYRIDARTLEMQLVTDELHKPNGLCFDPKYEKLYVADSGDPKNIKVWDLVDDGRRLRGGREFASMRMGDMVGGADGIRVDIDGNLWSSAGWAGDGYDGVHIFAPDGERIGQIVLPEICSNLCFGGPKRNRLFMTASQSLYAVYVETRGGHLT